MDYNQTAWANYNEGYVDPLFVPYMRYNVMDNQGNYVNINKWEVGPEPDVVNPATIRKGWRLNFMNQFGEDACPYPYQKGQDGWCSMDDTRDVPAYMGNFYTSNAYIPKRQFWSGYGDISGKPRRVSESFDMRSVNPNTGRYTVYYLSKQDVDMESRYAKLPTRDSYLGFSSL
jgi:hypothetical protein